MSQKSKISDDYQNSENFEVLLEDFSKIPYFTFFLTSSHTTNLKNFKSIRSIW